MAGWTNLTPSGGALAAGNAYLYEDTGALKYQGTSGSAATIVNADGTMASGGISAVVPMTSGLYYTTPASNSSVTANLSTAFYIPIFVPTTTTFDRIGFRTSTTYSGTGLVRLGVYSDSNGVPTNLVFDAGTVGTSVSNTLYQIIINQSLTAGVYWLVFIVQTLPTTSNYRSCAVSYIQIGAASTAGAGQAIGWSEGAAAGALASTVSPSTLISNAPTVWLRKA